MLFSRFASFLYRQGLTRGFMVMGADAPAPSEATYFHIQKTEGTFTFIHVTVIDTTRAGWQAQLEKNTHVYTQAQTLLDRVKNVALVYILVEPVPQVDISAVPPGLKEPYAGQNVYNVLWRVSLENGAITALPEQPGELFGLRDMITTAYDNANAPQGGFDAVSEAISVVGGEPPAPSNIVPIGGSRPATPRHEGARRKPHKVSLMTRLKYMNIYFYPKYTQPVLCYIILAANLLVLLGMTFYEAPNIAVAGHRFGGIHAFTITHLGEWWRLFTAMFVHFGAMHFIANTFGIIVFGTRVERYFGRIAFLVIYFGTGLMGSLFSFLNLHFARSGAVSGGASGAVYGLVAAVFIITRITGSVIETLHWRVMLLFIIIGLVMGFTVSGIDNAGHIGGMVGGVIIGYLFLLNKLRKQS